VLAALDQRIAVRYAIAGMNAADTAFAAEHASSTKRQPAPRSAKRRGLTPIHINPTSTTPT
jgi:hypothetical protein